MKPFGLLLALIISVAAFAARAETVILHTGRIPPYTIEAKDGRGQGMMIEIVTQALDAAGITYRLEDQTAWPRAQAIAVDEPNSLITPFARTAAREQNWTWISILLDETLAIYAKTGASGPKTKDELLRIDSLGVLTGSGPDSVSKELGLTPVTEPVPNEWQNAKKLARGRISAWMSQGYMAVNGMRDAGLGGDQIQLQFILRNLPLWVATSKKTSPEMVQRLSDAFTRFRETSAYAEILKRYQVR